MLAFPPPYQCDVFAGVLQHLYGICVRHFKQGVAVHRHNLIPKPGERGRERRREEGKEGGKEGVKRGREKGGREATTGL